jgi:hypothetical protein
MARMAWLWVGGLLALGLAVRAGDGGVGVFEAQKDVGEVQPAGTAVFDEGKKEYRVTSAGQNIWAKHDDFHFVYKAASGDVTLTAEIGLAGEGKNAHRKGGLMIRQGLEPDDAYADVMVHGDGHIGLQYRAVKGDVTKDVKTAVKAPAVVRIERKGDVFTGYVAAKEGEGAGKFEVIGNVTIGLKDPVYVGLAVTSHDAKESETGVFSKVEVKAAEGK